MADVTKMEEIMRKMGIIQMNKALKYIQFILFSLLLSSCQNNEVFNDAKILPEEGWDKNNIVRFDYLANDTSSTYNIIVDIRNSHEYSYQNFWLFIQSSSPDSIIFKDTLECVLADNYGRWLGKSSGSMYHLPVLFLREVKFVKPGHYNFAIAQGMRNDTLIGIKEVGLRIEKVTNKEN